MSNLFNLSTLLENTYSPELINKITNQDYISEGIDILRSMENQVLEDTHKLYSSVLEADSREAENGKFAEYFKQYQNTVNSYILKLQELVSSFSINIETFVDANKDILDEKGASNVVSTVQYKGARYAHLDDPEVPEIEPYKVFKKEFAFMGQLLQDLGPIGSDEQKSQVIATVYNSLSKEINDGWLKKVIEKITDCEDCKDGYAKAIYKLFVPESSVDIQIDIGTVKQAKLDILNAKQYVESLEKSVDSFIEGLSKVAEETGSMFFRNKDHKLPIKTDVDGIEDKTYRMNDYAFAQINKFIYTKTTQITELCNLYMVAISIKMDCIMKYLQQCKDIIDASINGVDNTPNMGGVDPGDSDIDNDGTPDSDDEPTEPVQEEEPSDDNKINPDEYDEDIQEFTPDGEDDDSSESPENVDDNSDTDVEQESYLFGATLFEKERAINTYALRKSIYEAVTEADEGTAQNALKNKAGNLGAFIDSMINQIKNIVGKMKEAFAKNYTPVIESIEKNRDTIVNKSNINNLGWTIDPYDTRGLVTITTLKAIKPGEDLSDKKKYFSTNYGAIIQANKVQEGSNSAKAMILDTIKGNEKPYKVKELNESMDFITVTYKKIADNVEKMSNSLSTNKASAISTANTESTVNLESTLRTYFEADSTDIPPEQKEKMKTSDTGKTYYRYSSELITAIMNINSMLMKKHLKFVNKAASVAGVQLAQPKLGGNDNTGNDDNNGGNDNK